MIELESDEYEKADGFNIVPFLIQMTANFSELKCTRILAIAFRA